MPSNTAAWIMGPKANPLEVGESPYPTPGPKDLLIKTIAVAINPLEYKIQDSNPAIGGRSIPYPCILGADVTGTVIATGAEVSLRKAGDRVIAHARGFGIGNPAYGAFQNYLLLPEESAILVPDQVSSEDAVVLPLACDTAMAGMFAEDRLALSTARLVDDAAIAPETGSLLLVWGGSSSVGCCAIQMAFAAGYEVFATASPRNHALCTSLGATKVFNHGDSDVENAIIAAATDKTLVGALDCIGDNDKTTPACARILARTVGRKKVVSVLTPTQDNLAEGVEAQRLNIPAMLPTKACKNVHAWMGKALADGKLRPRPDPMVVGEGLESIQLGIDTVKKGVSAAKVVIRL